MLAHARPCWQGLSPLLPLAGCCPCAAGAADFAICAIIGQSGGQGSHADTDARAGAPAITSMSAAHSARSVDAFNTGRR
jgi:hypothetical protein